MAHVVGAVPEVIRNGSACARGVARSVSIRPRAVPRRPGVGSALRPGLCCP